MTAEFASAEWRGLLLHGEAAARPALHLPP
jgi:hypothetical protein